MLRLLLCVAAYCTAVDHVESREARGATYVRTYVRTPAAVLEGVCACVRYNAVEELVINPDMV